MNLQPSIEEDFAEKFPSLKPYIHSVELQEILLEHTIDKAVLREKIESIYSDAQTKHDMRNWLMEELRLEEGK